MYNIVLSGNFVAGFDEEKAKVNAARLLKFDNEKINQVFQKKDIVIKKNVGEQQAQLIQNLFLKIGIECVLQPIEEAEQDEIAFTPMQPRFVLKPPPDFSRIESDQSMVDAADSKPFQAGLVKSQRYGRITYFNMIFLVNLLYLPLIYLVLKELGVWFGVFFDRKQYQKEEVSIFNFMILGLWFLIVCLQIVLTRKRLNDLGASSNLAYLLIPFSILMPLNSIMCMVLVFMRGSDGDNQYGPQPKQGSIFLASIFAMVMIVQFFWPLWLWLYVKFT